MALPIDPMDEPRMYQQTLMQDGLFELLENNKLVDCVLKIKDKEFPCHRLVLCACSSFFRSIFLSDLEESKKKEIVLEDVEPGVMGLVLKYLYTCKINVTEQNVQDIFAVANVYQIPSIFTVCVSFLQKRLSLSNCLAVFRLGLMLDCPRLALSARNYACERFQLISRDDEFYQLLPSELAAILANDNLNVETEEAVFEVLMNWVSRDTGSREKELPDLLDCIRLRLVSQDYLKEKVEKNELISNNSELQQKIQVVKDALAGIMPEVKKNKSTENGGAEGEDEEQEEEEGLLPGILNDTLRFGMFVRNLILMVNEAGAVAYDPHRERLLPGISVPQVPKNHISLVTKENQIFVAGGLFVDEQNKEDPLCSFFLQYDPGRELKETECTLDSVLVYDRESFKWGESESLPWRCMAMRLKGRQQDLSGEDVCFMRDKIYVGTGVTDEGLTDTLEVYDIATQHVSAPTSENKVVRLRSFPQERSSLMLVSLAGQLYAVGGFAMMPLEDSEEILPKEMNDIWRFDETERKWTGVLREIQYAAGATVLGVRLNTLRLTKM
ncbi:hypothetical protein KUCAC02_017157 [Chaenocephalus aceratus]|uniref:Uncharacterized protein n=1 Tax=Chaenocephalus aceratus TaxID=36190 RepID=A0ACB9W237_CHAAC|nr:hypothetical protein KUCAC02_017157 [Chaenocephalus aceratus]